MILTYIAFATLGVAISYAWGRCAGSREATDRIVTALEDGGTAFVKDKVLTGYVETYGDWFRCKNTARAELQSKLAAGDIAPLEVGTAEPVIAKVNTLIGAGDHIPQYQSNPGNVQHAGAVHIVGSHRAAYEHPFLNTGSIG